MYVGTTTEWEVWTSMVIYMCMCLHVKKLYMDFCCCCAAFVHAECGSSNYPFLHDSIMYEVSHVLWCTQVLKTKRRGQTLYCPDGVDHIFHSRRNVNMPLDLQFAKDTCSFPPDCMSTWWVYLDGPVLQMLRHAMLSNRPGTKCLRRQTQHVEVSHMFWRSTQWSPAGTRTVITSTSWSCTTARGSGGNNEFARWQHASYNVKHCWLQNDELCNRCLHTNLSGRRKHV